MRRPAWILAIVLVSLLGVMSRVQLAHWKDSHAVFRRTLAVNPDSWFSYRMLGLERQLADDPGAALRYFRKSMAINGNTYGHSELFRSLHDAGDLARADEVISDVVRRHRRPGDYFARAEVRYRLNRIDEAIADLEEASRRNPPPEMAGRIAHALDTLRALPTDSSAAAATAGQPGAVESPR